MNGKEIEDLLNTIEDNIPIDEIRSVDTTNGLTEYELDEESYQYQSLRYIKELQQENKQLKDKLQQSEEVIEEAIKFINNARYDKELKTIAYGGLNVSGINNVLDILNKYKKEESE